MSSRQRERSVVIALGATGSGKTGGLTRPMVQRYLARGGEVRILDPAGEFGEWGEWPGRRHVVEWIDELTAEGEGPAGGGWGPGLLVLDDADRYLGAGRSVAAFEDVWLANRHLGLDVLVNAHRPQGLPKDLIAAAAQLWLFRMQEPRALEYLAEMEALREAFAGSRHPLPRRAGTALRVDVHARRITEVRLF